MAQFPTQPVLSPLDGQTAVLHRTVMAGTIHAECVVLERYDPFTWIIRITNLLEGHILSRENYRTFGKGWQDIYALRFLFEPVANKQHKIKFD